MVDSCRGMGSAARLHGLCLSFVVVVIIWERGENPWLKSQASMHVSQVFCNAVAELARSS